MKKLFKYGLLSVVVLSLVIALFIGSSAVNCIVSVQGFGNYVAPRASAYTKATLTDPLNELPHSNSYSDAYVYLYWYDSSGNKSCYSDYSTVTNGPATFYTDTVAKWRSSNAKDFYSKHYAYVVYNGSIVQSDTDYIYDYD